MRLVCHTLSFLLFPPPFFFLKQLDVSINGNFGDFSFIMFFFSLSRIEDRTMQISHSVWEQFIYIVHFFIIGGIRMSRQDRVRLQFSIFFISCENGHNSVARTEVWLIQSMMQYRRIKLKRLLWVLKKKTLKKKWYFSKDVIKDVIETTNCQHGDVVVWLLSSYQAYLVYCRGCQPLH